LFHCYTRVMQALLYFLPINPTKRHAETTFTRPKRDTMSAFEPKGSSRVPTSLNRVSASSISQTVKTHHAELLAALCPRLADFSPNGIPTDQAMEGNLS
jgi:hypothetical protein